MQGQTRTASRLAERSVRHHRHAAHGADASTAVRATCPTPFFRSLREMALGRFECRTYDELKDDADYQRWLSDADGAFVIPAARAKRFLRGCVEQGVQSLLRKYDGELVVVCPRRNHPPGHERPLSRFRKELLGLESRALRRLSRRFPQRCAHFLSIHLNRNPVLTPFRWWRNGVSFIMDRM